MNDVCAICTPSQGDGFPRQEICSKCRRRLHAALKKFPELYVQISLEVTAGHPGRNFAYSNGRVTAKQRSESPAPLNLTLLDLANRCVQAIHAWAVEALPQAAPRAAMRPGVLMQRLCLALATSLKANLQNDKCVRLARDVWDLYEKARSLVGWAEPLCRVEAPCPVCDLRALAETKDHRIVCRACQAWWTSEEWSLVSEAPHPARRSASQLAGLYPSSRTSSRLASQPD